MNEEADLNQLDKADVHDVLVLCEIDMNASRMGLEFCT